MGKGLNSVDQRAKTGAMEPETPSVGPDLQFIVPRWEGLPVPVKVGNLAMIRAL